jgi:SAM-dependent methyltransferase
LSGDHQQECPPKEQGVSIDLDSTAPLDENPLFVERVVCPICASGNLGLLYRCAFTAPPIRDWLKQRYGEIGTIDFNLLEGAEYVLRECFECGLIFQQQIPNDEMTGIVYDGWADPNKSLDKKLRSVMGRGRTALEVMSIIDFLGKDPSDLRMLDFGMGWGFWCRIASAFGCDVYGLEVSSSRLSYAEIAGVKILGPKELHSLDFDFINTEQVFEHLSQPLETALVLSGALRNGGILKISVPNGMRVKRRLRHPDWTARKGTRRSMNDVFPFEHINCFTHQSLRHLGARVGLSPIRIPARLRYRYAPMWEKPKNLIKRTLGQHYRAMRGQETNVWFSQGSPSDRIESPV